MTGRQDPGSAWKAARRGPEPTQAHVDLRSKTARDMLAAVGLSGALFDNRADGPARREAFRQALHALIQPWARLAEVEMSTKLEGAVSLDFNRLFAADLSGRARASQSMVGGGRDVVRAAALAGLMEAEA